jgi:hypothetical protein
MDFIALGPAEEHIVTQITGAISKSKEEAHKLVAALEEIDIDGISAAMLDSDRKKTVIAMVGPMEGLVKSLGMNQLVPVLAKVLLAPKEEER